MRRLFGWTLAGTLASVAIVAGQTQPASPRLTAPQTKTFTFTRVYNTQLSQYRQPALLDLVESPRTEGELNPEEVLVAQERAFYLGEYQAWLRTWNEAARAKWRDRLKAEGKTEAQWSAEHKLKLSAPPRLRLITWVARRPYVLIQYEVVAEGEQSPIARKIAVLRLTGEGFWKASLDLERDPVYVALLQGKTEVVDERPNQ